MLANKSRSPRNLMNVALFIVSSLLLAPLSATAESITFVQTSDQRQLAQLSSPTTSLKKVTIGLDDEGNAMIRYGKAHLTFIYDAGSSSHERCTQYGNSASRQEVASLGGLSVKLGLAF